MLLLLGNKKKSNQEVSAIVRSLFGDGERREEISKEQGQEMNAQQLQAATQEVMTAINSDDVERCQGALCNFFDIYSEMKELD